MTDSELMLLWAEYWCPETGIKDALALADAMAIFDSGYKSRWEKLTKRFMSNAEYINGWYSEQESWFNLFVSEAVK